MAFHFRETGGVSVTTYSVWITDYVSGLLEEPPSTTLIGPKGPEQRLRTAVEALRSATDAPAVVPTEANCMALLSGGFLLIQEELGPRLRLVATELMACRKVVL